MVAKQGAEYRSLGTQSFSSLREGGRAGHSFFQSLPLPLITLSAYLSQGTPNVQFIPGAARGGTGLAPTLGRQVSAAGTAAPPGE